MIFEVWFSERFPVTDRDRTLYDAIPPDSIEGLRYHHITHRRVLRSGITFLWRMAIGSRLQLTIYTSTQESNSVGNDRAGERGSDGSQYTKDHYQYRAIPIPTISTRPPTHFPRLYDIYISPHGAAPVQTHRVQQTFPQTDEKIIMYIHGTHSSPLPPSPHDNPSPINHPKKT